MSLSEEQKALYNKDPEGCVNFFLDQMSENMDVKLPEPESTNLTNLSQAYELYKSNLTIVIDSVVSSEIFGEDISGEFSGHVETVKNIFLHHLLRQWCAENNYYTEALAFTSKNKEDVDSLTEILTSHLSGGIRNGSLLLRMMQQVKDAANKDLDMVKGDAGDAVETGSSSSTADTDGDDENSEDADLSGDDLLKF